MKIKQIFGVLIMAFTVVAGNLVQNGDFSEGEKNWRKSEWQKEFIIAPEAASPDRGNVMQMIRTARFADWTDTNSAVQAFSLPSPWQGAFRFSCDAKLSDNAEGYPLVTVDLSFSDGSHSPKSFRINVGKEWEHKEFIIPRDHAPVTAICINVTFRGVGTAVFDKFSIEEVEMPADLTLLSPVALNGVFGNSGVSFSGETREEVKYVVSLKNTQGEVVGTESGQGRNLQALFPEAKDGATISVQLKELFGDESKTYEFSLSSIDSAAQARKYLVFTGDSMEKIMPGQMPSSKSRSLSLALAGNEHEACQIALRRYPGFDIGHVAVEFSDFICQDNGERFPSGNLAFYQVGLIEVKQLTPHPANPWTKPGWFPDALLPVSRIKIPDDNTFCIWIDVSADKGMKAGTYAGTVTLRPENEASVSIPMSIQVYPFSLPDRPALKTAFGINWYDIERVYGTEGFEAVKRKYIEYVTNRRISPSALYPRKLEDPDIMADLAPRINTYNAGVNISENTDIEGWEEHVKKVLESPFAKDAYFYGYDEFKDDMRDNVRKTFGKFKEKYPEIATFATSTAVDITAEAMRDLNLDHLCVMVDYYDQEKAAKVRRENQDLEVWGYISFQPGYPYVNFMLEYPLIESRLFAWQSFNYELDGFLYWELCYYLQAGCESQTRKKVNPEDGPYVAWSKRTGADNQIFSDLNGDGKILYYGCDGPIGSIVLENIRDGLEDYDYLALVKDQQTARKIGLEISQSFTQFTRSPKMLRECRDRLAKMISDEK